MKLFSQIRVGSLALKHRVVPPPLTRMRTEPGNVPGDLMVEYYTQRVSEGGLLITDATAVTPLGIAYVDAPGMWTREQVAGWKPSKYAGVPTTSRGLRPMRRAVMPESSRLPMRRDTSEAPGATVGHKQSVDESTSIVDNETCSAAHAVAELT